MSKVSWTDLCGRDFLSHFATSLADVTLTPYFHIIISQQAPRQRSRYIKDVAVLTSLLNNFTHTPVEPFWYLTKQEETSSHWCHLKKLIATVKTNEKTLNFLDDEAAARSYLYENTAADDEWGHRFMTDIFAWERLGTVSKSMAWCQLWQNELEKILLSSSIVIVSSRSDDLQLICPWNLGKQAEYSAVLASSRPNRSATFLFQNTVPNRGKRVRKQLRKQFINITTMDTTSTHPLLPNWSIPSGTWQYPRLTKVLKSTMWGAKTTESCCTFLLHAASAVNRKTDTVFSACSLAKNIPVINSSKSQVWQEVINWHRTLACWANNASEHDPAKVITTANPDQTGCTYWPLSKTLPSFYVKNMRNN